jgi:hypothetical protein
MSKNQNLGAKLIYFFHYRLNQFILIVYKQQIKMIN